MKLRHRLFLYSLAVFFVVFSRGVFTEGDGTLVFTNEPTAEQLNSDPMYMDPSKETVKTLIQWSNSCKANVDDLRFESKFLTLKRAAASAASSGGWNWKSNTKKVAAGAEQVLTQNYSGLLVTFVNELINLEGQIDREQKYGLVCKELNAHIPKFNAGLSQWERMYSVATLVYDRWFNSPRTSGSEIMPYLHIYKSYPAPNPEYPTWGCKGNGLLSKPCDDTYDTPYEALKDHRIICGGDKDPNPNLAGCFDAYYTCQNNYEAKREEHGTKYCNGYLLYHKGLLPDRFGKCGSPYRSCRGSGSATGVHNYEPVYSYNSGKRYASDYRIKRNANSVYSKHTGNMSGWLPSFHGPTKYSQSISESIDESPNCSSCVDGSSNCPNVSNHSGGGTAAVSPSLSPSGGAYSASAGATHAASLNVPSAYNSVYWYVKSPSESGLGTSVSSVSGDGSSTRASFSWSVPSDASGEYVITAYTYLADGSVVQPSYTVSVGSSTPSTPSTPTTLTYACGVHSGSAENASAHAVQATCSLTNGWGHACTATGFYACQTHTCTFPTFACGNGACSVSVADREEHRRVCMHGHKYWSCNSTQLETHKTRGPCTRWVFRQKWNSQLGRNEATWVICGESWAKCDRDGRSCQDLRGIGSHQE